MLPRIPGTLLAPAVPPVPAVPEVPPAEEPSRDAPPAPGEPAVPDEVPLEPPVIPDPAAPPVSEPAEASLGEPPLPAAAEGAPSSPEQLVMATMTAQNHTGSVRPKRCLPRCSRTKTLFSAYRGRPSDLPWYFSCSYVLGDWRRYSEGVTPTQRLKNLVKAL